MSGLQRIGKHRSHIPFVSFVDDGTVSQPSFLLCSFLSQDMALVRMLAFDLSASGHLKAFLGS